MGVHDGSEYAFKPTIDQWEEAVSAASAILKMDAIPY
jgi:hypothetical protein